MTHVKMSATAERTASQRMTPIRGRRVGGLAVLGAVLVTAAAVSLAVGARALSPAEVWHGLFAAPDPDQRLTEIRLIVRTVRVPRTVLAIVAGVALGVGGALIQGHTRNPIADTGLLGVNAGASFAVVTVTAVFGLSGPSTREAGCRRRPGRPAVARSRSSQSAGCRGPPAAHNP